MTTYTHDDRTTFVRFPVGDTVPFRMVAPIHLERPTGSMRYPELAVDLPAELITHLSAAMSDDTAAQVVGIVVHLVSRRAMAVGPFDGSVKAAAWWNVPFNRLARNPNVLFVIAVPGRVSYEQIPFDLESAGGQR